MVTKRKTKAKKVEATKPKVLTAREKKAIIEKEVHCRVCNDGTLAYSCSDDGVPLCITHGVK